MNQLPQQMSDMFNSHSATGGPLVPVAVHPLIQTTYEPVSPQDQFINNWESSSLVTLTGFSSTTGAGNLTVATTHNKMQAYTATVTGSNSSIFVSVGNLLNQRHFTNTLTGTSTASLSSITVEPQLGVFTLRKLLYDTKIEPGTLTATVSGTNSFGVDMAGDYYDSGSGEFKSKDAHGGIGVDETIGAVLVDEGMFVVTTSSMREVATAVTAVRYKTSVLNTTISVFCKSSPDSQNYTLNPTSFDTTAISGTAVNTGRIQQSFNNILTQSSLTGNTSQNGVTSYATYMSGLVSSGLGWSPYITTLGLYSSSNDLLAVAKISTPTKKPTDLPLTFKVQIDV